MQWLCNFIFHLESMAHQSVPWITCDEELGTISANWVFASCGRSALVSLVTLVDEWNAKRILRLLECSWTCESLKAQWVTFFVAVLACKENASEEKEILRILLCNGEKRAKRVKWSNGWMIYGAAETIYSRLRITTAETRKSWGNKDVADPYRFGHPSALVFSSHK